MRLLAVTRSLSVSLLIASVIAAPVPVAAQGTPQLTILSAIPNIAGGQLVTLVHDHGNQYWR